MTDTQESTPILITEFIQSEQNVELICKCLGIDTKKYENAGGPFKTKFQDALLILRFKGTSYEDSILDKGKTNNADLRVNRDQVHPDFDDKYNPIAHPKQVAKNPKDFKSEKTLFHWEARHANVNRWTKRVRKMRQRKYADILSRKHSEALKFMKPPLDYAKQISDAADELKSINKNVCALDAKMIRIKMKNNEILHVPVWISVVDTNGVVYHEMIRHNSAAIVDWKMDAVFHGLTQQEVSKAKGFRQVRREILEIFQKYDLIAVCRQTVDFAALFFTMDSYYQILPKIFCVNSYFNCRAEAQGLGLKYISYILFNSVIQSNIHSPLVAAAYTLYAYLVDFAKADRLHSEVIRGSLFAKGHGFRCYKYPKNDNMAGRLHEVMRIVNDWPAIFKVKPFMNKDASLKAMGEQKYNPTDYIPGIPEKYLRPPYKLTDEEILDFARWKRL